MRWWRGGVSSGAGSGSEAGATASTGSAAGSMTGGSATGRRRSPASRGALVAAGGAADSEGSSSTTSTVFSGRSSMVTTGGSPRGTGRSSTGGRRAGISWVSISVGSGSGSGSAGASVGATGRMSGSSRGSNKSGFRGGPSAASADERRRSHHHRPATRAVPSPSKMSRSSASMTDYPAAAILSASSTSTDTRRETPGSFIVTPTSWRASSIVFLLWVMNTNCTRSDISRTMSQKRPTLWSSSGASTSSRRQNGAGFSSKIENTSATAVSAFSPPDS